MAFVGVLVTKGDLPTKVVTVSLVTEYMPSGAPFAGSVDLG